MQALDFACPPGTSQFSTTSERRPAADYRPSCCTADAVGGAQANALAAMAALASTCNDAVGLINQNPLGRYQNNGSCSYDCGFREQTWSWWADYRPTNANLASQVNGMNLAAPYATAFQPTRQWLEGALPGNARQLQEQLALIASIDAAIAASGQQTPEQQAQLAQAFTALSNLLASNLGQANQALGNLASFLSWAQPATSGLADYVNSCKAYIQQSAINLENDLIGKIACGAGDVRNTINGMLSDVGAKFARMQPGFDAVNAREVNALQAGDAVAGVFLGLQADSQLVGQQLDLARTFEPASPLRQMHLNIAGSTWNHFVQQADSQLQA
ncbi:hypothetical protein [Pseudomonas sp. NPDC089406]|uniref:hypothetical protein n=1 Tax=Pseudomonas sp. NPDC089406 TaxID=3364463 RepID=UPI00384EE892